MTGLPFTLDPRELVEHLIDMAGSYTLDELDTALLRVGPQRPAVRPRELHAFDVLLPRHASQVVPAVWSAAEHPLACLDRETWRDLFWLAGYTDNSRRRARPRLARRLYRGADEAHRDGWSWTDDRTVAEWFADRPMHRTPGRVWTAVVEPTRLLARVTTERPGEAEWVADTDGLAIDPAP